MDDFENMDLTFVANILAEWGEQDRHRAHMLDILAERIRAMSETTPLDDAIEGSMP